MTFAALQARLNATTIKRLGDAATVDGRQVQGIFSNAYATAAFDQIALDASRPALTVLTASIPANPAGAEVTVNGVDYIVRTAEPDGLGATGLTRLLLEQVYATEAP